jgi:hypothetical protein
MTTGANLIRFISCALLLAITSAALTSCSDPRAASTANFEKAAQQYYSAPAHNRFCVGLPDSDPMLLLWYGALPEDKGAIVVREGSAQDQKLTTLERAGLVTRESRHSKASFQTYRYRMSEKSKPFQSQQPGVLCYAKVKFLDVKAFSAPASFLGKTISEATIDLGYDDIADWMKERDMQVQWLGKDSDLKAPRQTKKVFVLMNDGWVVD